MGRGWQTILIMNTESFRAVCVGLLVLAVGGCSQAKVTESFEKSVPMAADGSLRLENINGEVTVEVWDRDEVQILAEKSARNEAGLERIEVQVTTKGDEVRIGTKYGKSGGWFSWNSQGEVKYALKVPARMAGLRIQTTNSRLEVSGVEAKVELETVNGSIEASGLRRDVKCTTVNGSIKVALAAGAKAESVSLTTVNGSCAVDLPDGFGAEVRAETVNGGISLDLPSEKSESTRRSLKARVGDGTCRVALASVNGGLKVF